MQTTHAPDDPTKAAHLAMTLKKDVLAKVLKHLNESELSRLKHAYEREQALGGREEHLLRAGKEFLEAATSNGASEHFKEALVLALGEDSAAQILRQDRWRTIASKAKPAALAAILKDERPEVVGIVLSKLPADYSAELISHLPPQVRGRSIECLAMSAPIASAASDALAQALEEALKGGGGETDQTAGTKTAAAMLNQLDSDVAHAIIEQIRAADPDRAARIENEMFHFENLLMLESRVLERILSEVPTDKLTTALKGMASEQRDIILGSLTDQVKAMVTQELEDAGRVPASEVRNARRAISNLALQMEREGKVRLHPDQTELVG